MEQEEFLAKRTLITVSSGERKPDFGQRWPLEGPLVGQTGTPTALGLVEMSLLAVKQFHVQRLLGIYLALKGTDDGPVARTEIPKDPTRRSWSRDLCSIGW